MNNPELLDTRLAHAGEMIREYGIGVFTTEKMLSLLLLSAMPECDADRLADILLSRFGSLEGIFSADTEALLETPGVDRRAVGVVIEVGRALAIGELSASVRSITAFDDYDTMGKFFVSYLTKNTETDIAAILLDDSLRLIRVVDIPAKKYGTAAMKPKYVVDAAIRYGATVVAIGFIHRGALAVPYDSEFVTARMLRDALSAVDIYSLEQFVVNENEYHGIFSKMSVLKSPPSERIAEFYASGGITNV